MACDIKPLSSDLAHMDYGTQAAAYVNAFMQNINWANAARL